MPFVSYAQNFEDVMLWRALKHVDQGFYIDVGAGAPREDSVTLAFSQRGWRGINVEPNPYCFAQLVENRGRDVNLPVAVGDRTGTLQLSIIPGTGLSTGDPSVARTHASTGLEVVTKNVELTTLSIIWSKYVPAGHDVHFLKIDVEGLECDVIRSNNWLNNRPWIVVVESTYQNSPTENYINWENHLVRYDYIFCYADGLNRFYVAQERSDLISHFKYPPNIFDGFEPPNKFDPFITVHEADLRQALSETKTGLKQAQAQLEQMTTQLEQTTTQLEQARATLCQCTSEANELRQARAYLNQRTFTLETQLLALTSSTLWRLMEPLRSLAGHASPQTRRNLRCAAKAAWWAMTPWHIPMRIRLIRERNFASKAACSLQKPTESRPSANENSIEVVEQQQPCSHFDSLSDGEFELCVRLMYRCYLDRHADADGLRHHIGSLRNGMPLSTLAREIENSPEAVERRQRRSDFHALSDGEFVVALAEFLFQGRGALPDEVEIWKNVLADGRATRIDLLRAAADAHLENRRRGERLENDPAYCWILGTDRWLVPTDWENKARELCLPTPASLHSPAKIKSQPFQHSGEYVVSAIASLYKGGRYIEQFLTNITTQSIFDRSELIIVDANSPEGENQIIAQYQKIFPNIIYKRVNYRLGIYDAWNVGVEMSRGRYLTNTNLDDLRRHDSFQLQAATLDRYDFVDVVYQDFFYSFDDSLAFEEVEKFGFKSDLPIVTPHNLLKFNSPHNAPMWRKSLHAELGLFDTSYRSAGDWEFWLRCLSSGMNFLKINTPHVAYFQNPQGVSTRPDTRGIEEGRRALRSYSDKLISRELRMSREALAKALGMQADWEATTSYYDVVQRQLNRLGAGFRDQIKTSRRVVDAPLG